MIHHLRIVAKGVRKLGYWILATAFIIMAFCQVEMTASADKSLSRTQAWEIVKKDVLKGELKDKIVYAVKKPLKAGYPIKSWEKIFKAPDSFKESWLFFIDDQPEANWQHHCRYVFVEVHSGNVHALKSLTPPDSMEGMEQIFPEKK